jgi:hypothetical protein
MATKKTGGKGNKKPTFSTKPRKPRKKTGPRMGKGPMGMMIPYGS